MGRIITGAVVGAVLVFVWGFVAHTRLPLGDMGISELPDEGAIVAPLRGTVKEPGFYMFPWVDPDATEEERKAGEQRYEAGPTGIVIYQPEGRKPMSPAQLGTQFLCNLGAALVAAFLLAGSARGYLGRVLSVAALGLFSWLIVDVPHWNWYGFPFEFTQAQVIMHVVGWLAAGIVMAAIVKPRTD